MICRLFCISLCAHFSINKSTVQLTHCCTNVNNSIYRLCSLWAVGVKGWSGVCLQSTKQHLSSKSRHQTEKSEQGFKLRGKAALISAFRHICRSGTWCSLLKKLQKHSHSPAGQKKTCWYSLTTWRVTVWHIPKIISLLNKQLMSHFTSALLTLPSLMPGRFCSSFNRSLCST